MDDFLPASNVSQFLELCRASAHRQPAQPGVYAPTPQQVTYFALVQLLKRSRTAGATLDVSAILASKEWQEKLEQLAVNLDEWGGVVADLQLGREQEWLLLQLQVEGSLRKLNAQQLVQQEAAQETFVKLIFTLRKIHTPTVIEGSADLPALVHGAQANLRNIYDFGSPFYAHAKLIARNAARQMWRRPQREVELSRASSAQALSPFDNPEAWLLLEEEGGAAAAQVRRLRLEIGRLLRLLPSLLSPRQTDVARYTLASRPRFWLAIELTRIELDQMLPTPVERNDDEIGRALDISVTSVRVHRSAAKQRIAEYDHFLGELFEHLAHVHGR